MQLTIREPGSAITHFIGCLMALIAASPLLIKAHGNATYMLAMTIFATSMVLLYAASTIYHSICHVSTKVLRNFQKLDHMMIFVLIATVLFNKPDFCTWVQTWARNFPMAICYQLFYCGPLVRLIFRTIFSETE